MLTFGHFLTLTLRPSGLVTRFFLHWVTRFPTAVGAATVLIARRRPARKASMITDRLEEIEVPVICPFLSASVPTENVHHGKLLPSL